MGKSAANAADESKDAAPAATRYLTLRIGFVLLAGEADNGGLTSRNSRLDDGTNYLKRRLTLILKVDNLLRLSRQSMFSGATRGWQRFADKVMRDFNILERNLRTNEDVRPAKPDFTFC